MRPVMQSEFDTYFDHATGEVPIWVLDEDEARRWWCENFDARSKVFFNLPEDSWVQVQRGVPAGGWQPGLNEENFGPFRESLAANVPWCADDAVMFAASNTMVLQSTWATFLQHWQGFLYLDSDAPMLLSPQHSRQCILFLPRGDALFIDASQPG
jgi:hypothetical protein